MKIINQWMEEVASPCWSLKAQQMLSHIGTAYCVVLLEACVLWKVANHGMRRQGCSCAGKRGSVGKPGQEQEPDLAHACTKLRLLSMVWYCVINASCSPPVRVRETAPASTRLQGSVRPPCNPGRVHALSNTELCDSRIIHPL